MDFIKLAIVLLLLYSIITDEMYEREFLSLIKSCAISLVILILSIVAIIMDIFLKINVTLSIIMLITSIIYLIRCVLLIGEFWAIFISFNYLKKNYDYDIIDILHVIIPRELIENESDEYDELEDDDDDYYY